MKLEDALDEAIEHYEWSRKHWSAEDEAAFETILRCADQEWQRREMREDGFVYLDQWEPYIKVNTKLPFPETEEGEGMDGK